MIAQETKAQTKQLIDIFDIICGKAEQHLLKEMLQYADKNGKRVIKDLLTNDYDSPEYSNCSYAWNALVEVYGAFADDMEGVWSEAELVGFYDAYMTVQNPPKNGLQVVGTMFLLLVVVVAILLAFPADASLSDKYQCEQLEKVAIDLNNQFPKQIDYATTATGVTTIYLNDACHVYYMYSVDERAFINNELRLYPDLTYQQVADYLYSEEGQDFLDSTFRTVAKPITNKFSKVFDRATFKFVYTFKRDYKVQKNMTVTFNIGKKHF